MTIYLDSDYKCHAVDEGECRPFDVEFFDFKCRRFIEGYRYIPPGESWTDESGETYTGEALFPWEDYNTLLMAQYEYINNFVKEVRALYDEQS